jgi:hypothetical protein
MGTHRGADYNVVCRYVTHPGMRYDVNRFSTHTFSLPGEVGSAVAAVVNSSAPNIGDEGSRPVRRRGAVRSRGVRGV